MIRLFDTTDKLFTTNGDKIIIPTRAEVFKEDNGSFYLQLEAPLDYIDYLLPNKILVANTPQGDQEFRITNVEKTKRKISLKALHISYDANNYLIRDTFVVDKTCNQALTQLNNATDNTSPFTVTSNIDDIHSYRCVRKSLYEAWQTVVERWGGHLTRDNFNVGVMNSIGADNGVTVRYGKNLKDITVEYNWDDVVTKLLPVGQDGLLLPEVYVTSTTQYDIPYTKSLNFDQSNIDPEDYETEEEYEQALEDDLRARGQAYVNENCIPKVSYTLQANLEKITDVGDTIEVIDERLGINLTTHLLSYTYDCILGKYIELEFGNFTNQLSNLLSGIATSTTELVNEVNSDTVSKLETELKNATDQIMGVLGNSYVIYDGDKILVVDTLPKENATNVIRINSGGIGFSTTGINGTFNSAWSINGTMNMQNINVINLLADLISGGNLKLTANNISIQSTNFSVDTSGNLVCSNADVNGKITADDGNINGYELSTDTNNGTKYLETTVYPEYDFDFNDYLKVRQYVEGFGSLTPEELIKYDINKDGEVDYIDETFILRMVTWHIDTSSGIHTKIMSNTGELDMNGMLVKAGFNTVFSATPLTGVLVNSGTVLGARVLYEDISIYGDTGTITLYDDIDAEAGLIFDSASYKYIEIIGVDEAGHNGVYTKFVGPLTNGDTVLLSAIEGTVPGTTITRRTKYQLQGTDDNELAPIAYGKLTTGTNGSTTVDTSQNYIGIKKVIGYK